MTPQQRREIEAAISDLEAAASIHGHAAALGVETTERRRMSDRNAARQRVWDLLAAVTDYTTETAG